MVYCLLELAKGEEGGIDRVKSVLRKQNMRGETALHDAIRGRNDDIVILLLMEDPQLARVPSEGMSPLCLAVVLEQYYIAIILHEKDNQLSYSGPDGQNVLHVSVLKDIEMSEILLRWNKELAKKQCDNGSTPLHLHLFRGGGAMVPILLEANLSAAYQPNRSGSFPIHIAASNNQLNAVISLLKKCPECLNLCDTTGRTFLHVAVENKSYNIVSYACGTPLVASILNTQDNNGNTVLHVAVQLGDLTMVCSLLREQKMQLNIPNNSGRTPRHLAWCMIPHGLFFGWVMSSCFHFSVSCYYAYHGSFDAFIMATTLAFVCASLATTGLMFSGMAMVDLSVRQKHFQLSVGFAASSVTSLGASFALGLYMVLAPVAHSTAIAVLVVTSAVMFIGIIEPFQTLKIIRALRLRLGKGIWRIAVQLIVLLTGYAFWPFIIIFGWPAYSAKYRHN